MATCTPIVVVKLKAQPLISIKWDQSLPVAINKLQPLSENEVSFQWISSKCDKECQKNDSCSIFVGGSHKEDQNIVLRLCIKIENRSSTAEWLLQCSYEKVGHRVVVSSPDTDVCAMHHFKQLTFFNLNEFWILSGRSNSANCGAHL